MRADRYAHARQFRRMRRELKRLHTYLGRVLRDVGRKIAGNAELEARFARLLGLVERLSSRVRDINALAIIQGRLLIVRGAVRQVRREPSE